jgi:hypothetical protein
MNDVLVIKTIVRDYAYNFVKSRNAVYKGGLGGPYGRQSLLKLIVSSNIFVLKCFYFSTKIVKISIYQTVKFFCQYLLSLLSYSS